MPKYSSLIYIPVCLLNNVKKEKAVHKVFKTITILKGIHAIIEVLLGIILLILSKEFISNGIIYFVEGKFLGDPDWFIAQYISQFGIDLSLSIKLFFAFYLISHGIVNLSLVYGIIKKPSLAYPVSLIIFVGFLIYQIYDYVLTHSLWMLGIILFDILFVGLLFYEYNTHLKRYSFLGKIKLIVAAKVPKIVEIKMPK